MRRWPPATSTAQAHAMLRVLALDPTQADAAKALREIDRRRLTRIQADRAAKVRIEDTVAIARRDARAGGGERTTRSTSTRRIEMLRAGDATGGLRELKAYVDANPGNRAARQRIGTAVAERARELEDQGAREQALSLYEQAIALRGDAQAPWAARVPPLKKTLSQEYFDKGTRAYRTNLAQAITFLETSVRYDPAEYAGSAEAEGSEDGAREAGEDRQGHAADASSYCARRHRGGRTVTSSRDRAEIDASCVCRRHALADPAKRLLASRTSRSSACAGRCARSRSSFAFWLPGSSASTRSHLLIASSRFWRWNACAASRS